MRKILLVVLAIVQLTAYGLAWAGSHTWPSVADYDFYNHTYTCDNAKIKLTKGQYRERGKPCNEFWWLAYINCSDIDSDGDREAIVLLRRFPCGSILWTDDIFVYKMVKGELHQMAHLWQEDLESIAVIDGCLVIIGPYWKDTDAHCCPSMKERAVFKWKAGKLEKAEGSFMKIERK